MISATGSYTPAEPESIVIQSNSSVTASSESKTSRLHSELERCRPNRKIKKKFLCAGFLVLMLSAGIGFLVGRGVQKKCVTAVQQSVAAQNSVGPDQAEDTETISNQEITTAETVTDNIETGPEKEDSVETEQTELRDKQIASRNGETGNMANKNVAAIIPGSNETERSATDAGGNRTNTNSNGTETTTTPTDSTVNRSNVTESKVDEAAGNPKNSNSPDSDEILTNTNLNDIAITTTPKKAMVIGSNLTEPTVAEAAGNMKNTSTEAAVEQTTSHATPFTKTQMPAPTTLEPLV